MCRGVPILDLDIHPRDRFRWERVQIDPLVHVHHLDEKVRPVLNDSIAPPRLPILGTWAEQKRLQRTTETKADVGVPSHTLGLDTQHQMAARP